MTPDTTKKFEPPPLPLMIAFAVCFGALIAITIASRLDIGTTRLEHVGLLFSRDLLFDDTSTGSVQIRDAHSGVLIDEIVPGKDGFVRMVMRTLARDRMLAGGSKTTPFTLARWDDGHLTISDPSTGRRVELVGFGATNEEAFSKLLVQRSTQR
jgi:putative photosynthetic complex assembly protein